MLSKKKKAMAITKANENYRQLVKLYGGESKTTPAADTDSASQDVDAETCVSNLRKEMEENRLKIKQLNICQGLADLYMNLWDTYEFKGYKNATPRMKEFDNLKKCSTKDKEIQIDSFCLHSKFCYIDANFVEKVLEDISIQGDTFLADNGMFSNFCKSTDFVLVPDKDTQKSFDLSKYPELSSLLSDDELLSNTHELSQRLVYSIEYFWKKDWDWALKNILSVVNWKDLAGDIGLTYNFAIYYFLLHLTSMYEIHFDYEKYSSWAYAALYNMNDLKAIRNFKHVVTELPESLEKDFAETIKYLFSFSENEIKYSAEQVLLGNFNIEIYNNYNDYMDKTNSLIPLLKKYIPIDVLDRTRPEKFKNREEMYFSPEFIKEFTGFAIDTRFSQEILSAYKDNRFEPTLKKYNLTIEKAKDLIAKSKKYKLKPSLYYKNYEYIYGKQRHPSR